MYGNTAQAIDNRAAIRKDQPKLADIREGLAMAHGEADNALSSIEAALDRIDGSVPQTGAVGAPKEPSVTLVGSLHEQVSFARIIAERASSLAARLAALG